MKTLIFQVITFIMNDWVIFTEEGLEYKKLSYIYNNQKINRLGINCIMGFQPQVYSQFVLDFFWGFAMRYSLSEDNKPLFGDGMFSYGYSGMVFLTGLKIGFGVR